MKHIQRVVAALLLISSVGLCGGSASGSEPPSSDDAIEHGRYLIRIAGCNDCHTPGYLLNEGKVDESLWLTGSRLGWRGPWGTTYAANLRLFMSDLTEDQWVAKARVLKARPPMPWFNLRQMHEQDLRAIYRFIVSLGEAGDPAPVFVPPDQEPSPPYATFP